ncbi:MAG: DUF1302 domain-containing protein [Candidatus Thiodiazotropha sp.]
MIQSARIPKPYISSMVAAVAMVMACGNAQAFRFDTGSDDLKIRWDNTLKYSTIYRLHDPDETQLGHYLPSPAGDGDYNFKKGIASNRLDLLSEFDLVHNYNKGFRISATGWYDRVYNTTSDNPGVSHNQSVAADEFNSETETAVGKDLELLDAFGFYKGQIGDMPASVRLGRHTVIYGETLMSGANGIAAAQGPVDIVKAATVPGAQVKEFLLPTNQISATLQPLENLSLGAYYQFKWEESAFFPAGSFLSPNDVVGPGNESFLQVIPGQPWPQINHGEDLTPDDSGQWGMQVRYRPEALDVELGIYAANYHDKLPSAIYTNVTPTGLTYSRAYQENIRTYGVSASTVLFDDNVSIEASVRDNMPLTGGLCPEGHPTGCGYFVNNLSGVAPVPVPDNNDNPAYAVGKTRHVTLVDIHIFQPNFILRDGGSVATQFDWHQVHGVTKNPEMIDPTTTKSASTVTVAFTGDYYQVMNGLDLHVPIVWTHNLAGRSRTTVGWIEHGGSLDVGLNFDYRNTWKGGLNYHRFQGREGPSIGNGSFDQTQFDRDYVSFNISRTF